MAIDLAPDHVNRNPARLDHRDMAIVTVAALLAEMENVKMTDAVKIAEHRIDHAVIELQNHRNRTALDVFIKHPDMSAGEELIF